MESNLLLNSEELFHRILDAGNDWADKNAAASAWEETQKTFLSTLAQEYSMESKSAAERMEKAAADTRYEAHLKNMVEARKEANRARVLYDSQKVYVELQRTNAATVRAEMGLR